MAIRIARGEQAMNCDQCEMLSIQGLACHEHGCPNGHKLWIDEKWVELVMCFVCNFEYPEGDPCCEQEEKVLS